VILSPFDPAAVAMLATFFAPRPQEQPVADSADTRLAVILARADRPGPYSAGRDGLVVDGAGHVLAMTLPAPLDPALRLALAEFFARALNALPAVIVATGLEARAAE
jgi:hypothetical protein